MGIVMTSLLRIFVEAMVVEKARYQIGAWHYNEWAVYKGKSPSVFRATNCADCERFVAKRAARAGVEAIIAERCKSFPLTDAVGMFLIELAGEHDDR